ncbi:MAG TPA: DNA mismatch repair protein MutS [Phycisphaerales bacterium]|nr:DNA mismatch repair protein MutS [Phycisphaerales bacterium]
MAEPRFASTQTPAMKQYFRFKAEHPDCLLFFRMGDFYELFYEDAELVSKQIGLTLTERTGGVPLAGIPHHQLEPYLNKLVALGHRVAIADQTQDPKEAKGVVDRAVTRVVTAGTLVDAGLVDGSTVNRIAAVVFSGPGDDSPASVAVAELSTGEFFLFDAEAESIADELATHAIRELLYAEPGSGEPPPRTQRLLDRLNISGTNRPAWSFRMDEAREALLEQFEVSTLSGFGLDDDDPAIAAAGALVRYLRETQAIGDARVAGRPGATTPATLAHLRPPKRASATGRCIVDAVSLRALEVENTIREGSAKGSLLGLFLGSPGSGGCRTAMGKRLVRDWLCRPSGDLEEIESRHACVAALVEDRRLAGELAEALSPIQDVARIAGRLALGRASPREVVGLGTSSASLDRLIELTDGTPAFKPTNTELRRLEEAIRPLTQRIAEQCVDSPPTHLRDGGLFRDGVDPRLDEARSLQRDSASWLAAYQQRLADELDLPGIKVGFNRVFGYYVELTAAQAQASAALIAEHALTRKQTLKNAERYITPELKDFEEKVLHAEARALEIERELFTKLVSAIVKELDALGAYARTVARADVLLAFADRAARRGWTRPTMTTDREIDIADGRHPVLEESLEQDFVPNSVTLGGAEPALALITGPNMAGKSTFIRQVALITLLAHAGSFVPAASATIGLTDRIFTRVGADDALHRGQSTFMVEMIETANILNHATNRSLVILDEIGRGTSTFDGLSLAWAIIESLTDSGPRTLFATHYHELTELEEQLAGRVRNLHVMVREWSGSDGQPEIVFLHQIKPGRSESSFGIHVARLAGVPAKVTDRAREILSTLAVQHGPSSAPRSDPTGPAETQLSLFTEFVPHPAVDRLREIKLDELSPIQAFDELRRLCAKVNGSDSE